ncbi:excinuclease ABC subunit UvrB [Treponema lecithinolyticum]|uniref:UvrABC system protein B n=1 Tax=Treponema lecithinolyticum ATCC 700332 TaxID=1321815 RepID=A0ABN0P1A4_TRELE|nr:excinuclease ABC subunit UvrB [Treponema lecithinolyticum]ERJ94318.1 excinuclease ABC, B subunit [Treponema lecithinolyticum ATCC 700332]
MRPFKVISSFEPSGDQPQAIETLARGFLNGERFQTLKGVTGSGKTFTMAKIIEQVQRPTLIISHNKTLSAQLYREFKGFFPNNAVEYFVSYYDYYQPEAYVPARDLYIEKDASINDEIDRMRLSATYSLVERRDVIVVATVSCIYGLGMPEIYRDMSIHIEKGERFTPDKFAKKLVSLQYERNDAVLERGNFRIRGDVMEIFPAYMHEAYRIELDWEEIVRIRRFDPISGEIREDMDELMLYPAKHFIVPPEMLQAAQDRIKAEMENQVEFLLSSDKNIEAERLKTRTTYDLEMIAEMGYCPGIENYSGPITGRQRGQPPATLLHYFPDDFLCMIDESHVTLSQIGAMYEGDRSRKTNLINFGFRLPSALDNRPLKFAEFEKKLNQTLFVSATPREEEIKRSSRIVEQIIRPTGLLDPNVEVRPSEGQMQDIYGEIKQRIAKNERCLVLTLTKKMAEDLTEYLDELHLKVKYIHSEVETIERVEILKGLRAGEFDVLVGINLLREGIDLPEVSFIAILDADKIGFLRSATSLIQIIGRAARNSSGTVVMYADRVSEAMKEAIEETNRRRSIQQAYNSEHGITPKTVAKAIDDILVRRNEEKKQTVNQELSVIKAATNLFIPAQRKKLLKCMERQMTEHAERLEFEEAAAIRDEIEEIKNKFG